MTDSIMTLVNGEPDSGLPATDRGLQFGDGVFETIAVRDGLPVWLEQHLSRLRAGCEQLRFEILPDPATLRREVSSLCDGHAEAVLKLIVTRGSSSSGYSTAGAGEPNRILVLKPGSRHYKQFAHDGIQAGICRQRMADSPALAGIKHLNRLEQVLARIECAGRWQEGLMLDSKGRVIEGTMSNLFLVRDGKLVTPRLEQAGVRGLARDAIIGIAGNSKQNVEVRDVMPEELHNADEMFVSNSLIGIWPVRRLEEYSFSVGPVTRLLQHKLAEVMC